MRPTPLTAFVLCAIAASLSGCEEASSGVDAPDKGDRDATPSCRGDTCDDSETSPPDEAQCGGDGDCPEGEVCHQGACQVGCRSDTDCQEGEVCEALSCATGCRNPSDCPTGFTCVAGQCEEEGCSSDEDCGAGARCSDETCQEIGAAACESDDDCGLRWRCSAVTGLCIDTLCAADGDCSTQTWCLNGLCEPRRAQLGQVNLARQYITGPSDHRWALSDLDQATFGGGGGLFDMDGDLDLDLFLGGRVTGSTTNEHCVYENVSEPGALRFEKVEEYCNQSLGDAESAWAIDVEGDGVEELLLLGRRQVTLLRFSPQVETTDLLESLPERDLRRLCTATSALVQDVDHDGMIDIVVGCRLPSQVIDQIRQTSYPNIFIRQTSPGQFLPSEGPFQETYGDRGSTLALGSIDVDLDGLDDILVVNDAYIGDFMTEFEPPSGGVFRRCSPDEDCIVELLQFGIPPRDFGSFMGLGNVHVDGIGDHIYITDISSNHLITYSGQEVADVATDLGVDLASNNNVPLFAWSVIVDDFDRNGLDDFIVTQGAVEDDFFQFQFHFEGLLLQRADGDFTLQTEEAGLMPHSSEDSGTTIAYASRGGGQGRPRPRRQHGDHHRGDGGPAAHLLGGLLWARPTAVHSGPARHRCEEPRMGLRSGAA